MSSEAVTLSVELIPDLDFGGFTARVPDIPAYGAGGNREEAIAHLKVALSDYIGTYGLEDALARVGDVRTLQWNLSELA
jgi:hypothetical protein